MPAERKQLILLGLIVLISTAVLFAGDKKSKSHRSDSSASAAAPMQMEDDKRIIHALNRFTFGARPADVEKLRAEGLDKWFDEQLHPEKIDPGARQLRLGPFCSLKMSTREMVENFPPAKVLKGIESGRMAIPLVPAENSVYNS